MEDTNNEIFELYAELAHKDTLISELEHKNYTLKIEIEKLKGYISCLTATNKKRGDNIHNIDCQLEHVILDVIKKLPNINHILHDVNFSKDTICNFYFMLLTGEKNRYSSIAFIDKTIVYKDLQDEFCYVESFELFTRITKLIRPYIVNLIKQCINTNDDTNETSIDESVKNIKENGMFLKNSKILLNVCGLPIQKILKMYQNS